MNEPVFHAPVNARWDPIVRHDVAMKRIRFATERALGHPDVRFTLADVEHVALLMGFDLRGMPRSGIEWSHTDDTQRANSGGRLSNRSAFSKPLDPDKTYRIRSTGEKVTGAELLRRREQKA